MTHWTNSKDNSGVFEPKPLILHENCDKCGWRWINLKRLSNTVYALESVELKMEDKGSLVRLSSKWLEINLAQKVEPINYINI